MTRAGRQLAQLPPPLALLAAHFEQIGEIIAQRKSQSESDRRLAMVADRDPLVGDAFPEVSGANDMQRIARQYDAPLVENVGIGEIGGQRKIVVSNARAEQQRLHSVDQQFESREIAGVVIEQAVGAAGGRPHIAVAVEDGESIGVLEDAPRAR